MRRQIVAAFIVLMIVGATPAPAQTSSSVSLSPVRFEVVSKQLGLRLESARGPVPTLVIISAQLPHTE